MVEWDRWGLFISLITPLILGVGAWVNDAVSKRKQKDNAPKVPQGMPVDYETDYIELLKRSLADARKENFQLKKQIQILQGKLGGSHGNSDRHSEK